jgi:REP element-mobilizing transposase RayT
VVKIDASSIEQKYQRSRARKNTRMKKWDYSERGWYFVTICVKNHHCIFGEIQNKIMRLNNWGRIAKECWQKIPKHFPDVEIDEFVIMPNHVHGIVVIHDDNVHVGNKYIYSLTKKPKHRNMMQLSKIIATYKAAVTRKINKISSNNYFQWQSSFHDHIIRNEKELMNIQNYIFSNPDNWRDDGFFIK